ncbi:hypothetical protein CIB84_010394 [Bambusicola thoracicus]|uniref:Uncharacterized protein n=1 Tax=Bambusicola thoracicus TaxID=9083 RepID=A0A2P4SNZ9_BAMTH|nr:hypothetical protein CIB84_010394 [Bambusicola thoracicus]
MEVESSLYTDLIFCNRVGWRNIVRDNQQTAKSINMHKITKNIGELTIEGAGDLMALKKQLLYVAFNFVYILIGLFQPLTCTFLQNIN